MYTNHLIKIFFLIKYLKNAKDFELDYWGLSNLDALKYLINNEYSNSQ